MAKILPFRGIRPSKERAAKIAALPYDVYNRKEAKAVVEKNPESFLAIDRAETNFSDEVDTYDEAVYQKAHDLLWQWGVSFRTKSLVIICTSLLWMGEPRRESWLVHPLTTMKMK